MKGHKSERIGVTTKLLFILQVLLEFSAVAAMENVHVLDEQDFSRGSEAWFLLKTKKPSCNEKVLQIGKQKNKFQHIVFPGNPAHAYYYHCHLFTGYKPVINIAAGMWQECIEFCFLLNPFCCHSCYFITLFCPWHFVSYFIDLSSTIKIKILDPLLAFKSIFDRTAWDDA